MKDLSLIIKQEYFDRIMSGTKKFEYREVKPTTIKRLLQLDEEGYEIEDEHGNAQPIEYNRIIFYVGYRKDRDCGIVKVKSAHCELIAGADGEPVIYVHNNQTWVKEQVVYELGKIAYCNNKKWHWDRLNDPLCYPDIEKTENDREIISKAMDAPSWDSSLHADRCDSRKAFEIVRNMEIRNYHYEESLIGEL